MSERQLAKQLWLAKEKSMPVSLIHPISTVPINGIAVHCLIFETPAAGCDNYARWDCINGWTTTMRQAKKRFPNGLHGKKH